MNSPCAECALEGVIVGALGRFVDQRGWLLELFRHDELPPGFRPAMGYVSQTNPGVVRGPHEHRGQTDYFVFAGPGDFVVYLWDRRSDSPTHGQDVQLSLGATFPSTLIVPPGVVHAYKNVSEHPGWVYNFPDRLFGGPGRSEPVDEVRWESRADSPFVVE